MKSANSSTESNVIQTKFGTKQSQKGKNQYQHDEEIAADIPMYDRTNGHNVPGHLIHAYDKNPAVIEEYDHFIAEPIGRYVADIMGITKAGLRVHVGSTNIEVSVALADAFNRGGFSNNSIQKTSSGYESED